MHTLTILEQDVTSLMESSTDVVVNNSEDLNRVTACIKGIKGLQKKVSETFDPIVDKAHQSHKESISQRDKYLKPLQELERKYKVAISDFNKRIEAAQREREQVANESLAKVAEAKRQELLNKANESSNVWESEVFKEQAKEVKPITVDVQKKVIESEGLSLRKNWKARIVDFDLIPREYLIANESLLNKVAKESEKESHIPGVEFYNDASVIVK